MFGNYRRVVTILPRFSLLISVLGFTVFLTTVSVAKDEPIVFAGDKNFPPYQFLRNQEVSGFDVEVAQAVGEILDRPVRFRLTEWNQAIENLRAGRVDAMVGMSYSTRRDATFDFGSPYLTQSFSLFVRTRSETNDIHDLHGKNLLIQEGSVVRSEFDDTGAKPNFVTVRNGPTAIRKLSAGLHHAALVSRTQGLYLMQQYNYDNLRIVSGEIHPHPYSFAVFNGNQSLLEDLNYGLNKLKKTSRYQNIYDRWFSRKDSRPLELWKAAFFTVFPGLVLLAGIASSTYYTIRLRDYWIGMTLVVLLIMFSHQLIEFWGWIHEGTFVEGTMKEIPETFVNVLGSGLFLILALSRKSAVDTSNQLQETREMVEEKKNYLEGIINSAQQMIFVKNWDGEFQIANEQVAEMYDARRDELIGRTDAYFNPDTEEVDSFLEADREVMRSGEVKEISEEPVTNQRTGETRWFHTLKVPLFTDRPIEDRQVLGVSTDVTERKQFREDLEESLREKETLLGEIHHRVKNNLQIVQSMLRMEMREADQGQSAIQDCINRIYSMALLHEKLYQTGDLDENDLSAYFEELCQYLKQAVGKTVGDVDISISVDLDSVPIGEAVSFGLVINELVANSLEHGYREGASGHIEVSLRKSKNPYLITVKDDGNGFPTGMDIEEIQSTGMRIVNSIVEYEFAGEVNFHENGGVTAELILFPQEKTG